MLHRLWGIDAVLDGHEGSIVPCLPVVHYGPEGRVATARTYHWSLSASPPVDVVLAPLNRVAEWTTKLRSEEPLTIGEQMTVTLIGPEYKLACAKTGYQLIVSEWISIQSGFVVKCMALDGYTALAKSHAEIAQRAFDDELRIILRSGQSALDPIANAALLMLEGNSEVSYDVLVARQLAVARLANDADTYRKVNLIGCSELNKSEAEVDALFKQYLQTLA